METNKLTKMPTLSAVTVHMESTGAYTGIFPEMFKLLNIILILPVGTASVQRSVSYMKLIKTRIHNSHNSTTDRNLGRLMRIAIESPELSAVDFNEVLDIKKRKKEEFCPELPFIIKNSDFCRKSPALPLYEALTTMPCLSLS